MTPIFANSAYFSVRGRLLGVDEKRVHLKARYGFVVHPIRGPMLMDTGCSAQSVTHPKSWRLRAYNRLLRPEPSEAGQIGAFLARQGLTPKDIRVVLLSHFHPDHISGLDILPNAKILASKAGWADIQNKNTIQNALHGYFKELLPDDFGERFEAIESRNDFELHGHKAYDLFGDESVLAVPLPGHAPHQFGFYFPQTARDVFYAADAHWLLDKIRTKPAFNSVQNRVLDDPTQAQSSLKTVEAFAQHADIVLAHDPKESPYDDAHS